MILAGRKRCATGDGSMLRAVFRKIRILWGSMLSSPIDRYTEFSNHLFFCSLMHYGISPDELIDRRR